MKKYFTFLLLIIFLAAAVTGCAPSQLSQPPDENSDSEISKVDSIPFSDDQLYAVAYLGYEEIDNLQFYTENYLDSDNIPIHYLSGDEYYLIIPRYASMPLSLYENNIETMESTLFFTETACTPFIVQCNISDIFPNLTIRMEYDGETMDFSPHISLKDGAVEVGHRGLNITHY